WEATVDASATPAPDGFVSTYYPGTTDAGSAALIDVGAGGQLRGVNITLARGRTYRVRGRVEGRPDANISIFPHTEGHLMGLVRPQSFVGPPGRGGRRKQRRWYRAGPGSRQRTQGPCRCCDRHRAESGFHERISAA